MVARVAARLVQRRFRSSGGKVLSEEEKAAENVYIKKMEQEKLEKLARKGPSSGEQASSTTSSAASEVKAGGVATESTSAGMSTDKNRNYAVLGWPELVSLVKAQEVGRGRGLKVVNGIF